MRLLVITLAAALLPLHARAETCAPGKLIHEESAGHCCWPEQVWSKLKSKCVDAPRCPTGFVREEGDCEAAEEAVAHAQAAGLSDGAPRRVEPLRTTETDPKKLAFALREQALKYFKANDFDTAERLLQQSLKLNDQDPESHKLCATVMALSGDKEQAVEHYKRYLALASPSDPNYKSVRKMVDKFEAAQHAR